MTLLEENSRIWSKVHPMEAFMLPFTQKTASEFETEKELKKWFSSLDLEKVELLYVFGLGNGEILEVSSDWLAKNPKRALVILENDLEVIRSVFETRLLSNRQVHLHFFQTLDESERVFNRIFWKFPLYTIQVVALPSYEKKYKALFNDLYHLLHYEKGVKTESLQEYLSGGHLFFSNFYRNLKALGKAGLATSFFGKFLNVPAIISGAGPSLQKQFPLLKTLTNRALIFGGSSSLTAFDSANLKPHFGAGIDPNIGQLHRLERVKDLSYPFFYRNRFYPEALKLLEGLPLYVPGSGGYDVGPWFEEALGIETVEMEEGQNVVNFCLEIAHLMGCNPIIFVGMDLAFTDQKQYSGGIVEDNKVENNPEYFMRKGVDGKDVLTQNKWLAEAKWISNFQQSHPGIDVINATEGGLGFEGVRNLSLKEVADKYLVNTYEFNPKLAKICEESKRANVTEEKVADVMELLRQSLIRCIEHLDLLLREYKKSAELLKKEPLPEITQSGLAALAEIELEEEPAWSAVLSIFNEVTSRLISRDLEELAKIEDKKLAAMKRMELNFQKFEILKSIAVSNLELLQKAIDQV